MSERRCCDWYCEGLAAVGEVSSGASKGRLVNDAESLGEERVESQVEGRVAFIIAIFKLQVTIKQTYTIDRSPRIQISLAIPELACAFLQ